MATTKLWAVSNNLKRVQDYALDKDKMTDLASVLSYAQNSDKTEHQYYMAGINCSPETALDEFNGVKERFGKQGGNLAYHGYMSFKPGECTPEEALKIGTEFAKEMWGDKYQICVSVHLNTECLHCHFVVNSVSFKDGTKLRDDEKNWNYFRHRADEICAKYGKSVVESKKEREPTKRDKYVKEILDYGLARCSNFDELEKYFLERGHKCQFDPALKHWTITPKGWTKPYRISHLEKVFDEDYSKEAILARLQAEPEEEYTPKPRTTGRIRVNSYPSRMRYIEKTIYPSFDQEMRMFVRFSNDVVRLLGGKGFRPLKRYRIRTHWGVRELGPRTVSYGPNTSGWVRYESPGDRYRKDDRLTELQERVNFLATHNIRTLEEANRYFQNINAELEKIEAEKKLLEARSKTEKVHYDTGALDKKRKELLHERSILKYYQEERDYGSPGRR